MASIHFELVASSAPANAGNKRLLRAATCSV